MLKVSNLSGGYGGKAVLHNVSFTVNRGEMFGILGPNGSGKTTLLKMISGVLPYKQGSVFYKDRPLSSYSTKQLAKMIAVLPQHTDVAFPYTVKETVSLGRYAHQKGLLSRWHSHDEEIVTKVMEQTGVLPLKDKNILELSGGERQRVNLAQALAQEPDVLLLDEPTNHLDLSYQKELLDLLKEWATEKGLTVISIFHDLNLASLYCDRLLLLNRGEIDINDKPGEVLQENRIKEVYKADIQVDPHPQRPVPQIVFLPRTKERTEFKNDITPAMLQHKSEYIALQSPFPLKTMSSGVIGSGFGWHQTFVNRHVDRYYSCSNFKEDMANFLLQNGFVPQETVGMMTAVELDDAEWTFLEHDDFSIMIVVTAGVGNAVDVSKSFMHSYDQSPGTINTWIFVNGTLSEEAFIQSVMTATEAKAKVLEHEQVIDQVTGTIATGTSTDSILVAATQKGKKLDFAGTITPLGKLIASGVYECTKNAIRNSRKKVEKK